MAKVLSLILLTIALVLCSASDMCAQTTEFTYQGSLKDGSNPANGNFDFEFALFDSLVNGTQIGLTLSLNGVVVSNGIFDAKLDFGNKFPGANRFLEIRVRQTGGGAFNILSPRQPFNSVPYSMKSISADSATSAVTATNATQLAGQPPSFYQNAANLSSGTIPDARLAGAYTGALTLSNAGNVFNGAFSGSGSGLTTLNASNVSSGTLAAARLPNPLALSGTSVAHIIKGDNASTSVFARGVHGVASGATGATIGVLGESTSTSGTGVAGLADSNTGGTTGVSGQSDSTSGRGVYGVATAASGTTYGGSFQSSSTNGNGVFGWATADTGLTFGVHGQSNSTSGRGVDGFAIASSGTTYGGRFQSASTSGFGVYGSATAATGVTYGGWFQSVSSSGLGVRGSALAAAGTTYGGWFESESPDGRGVFGRATAGTGFTYGGRFEASSTDGVGVFSLATAGTGATYGVFGQNDSTNGRGVYGLATAETGANFGVWGRTYSTSGRGVLGSAEAESGSTYGVWGNSESTSGRGVYGTAHYFGAGTAYGVYGALSTLLNGYAVYANGDMGASGSKPFRIDHPDDPANKYLFHYASESPEVINFYRGTAVLDDDGEAVVELPSYFAKINKTPSYQLTAIGAPMPMLHVAQEIDEAALRAGAKAGPGTAAPVCSFRIAGGVPGAKVSWRVEAVRNDRWLQMRGAPVVVEKQGIEKGTYQHPELYDLPAEKGVDYDKEMDRSKPKHP